MQESRCITNLPAQPPQGSQVKWANAAMRIIDHVDLRVRDLATAAGFYRSLLPLLGFTEQVDLAEWLQFEARGSEVTAFFGVTEDPTHQANRNRIAFWAESNQRVDEFAVHLVRIGATHIEGPGFESESYYAVYFNDPSGNPLEICHRATKFNSD